MTKSPNKMMGKFLGFTLKWFVRLGRWALTAAAFLAPAVALATPVYADLYVFGDSLSDTGNFFNKC